MVFILLTVALKSERRRDVPFLKLHQPTNVCTIYCCCKSGSVIKCFYCGDQMLTKADLSFRKGILGKNIVLLNRKEYIILPFRPPFLSMYYSSLNNRQIIVRYSSPVVFSLLAAYKEGRTLYSLLKYLVKYFLLLKPTL